MAKGPGPALLLAGAAALLLLSRKKESTAVVGGGAIDPESDIPGSDAGADVGGGPVGGGSTGGSEPKENPKTVPNPSGDPEGYDTKRWQDGYDVRVGFATLGYLDTADLIEQPLTDTKARAAVKKFQQDYSAGDLTVELGPFAGEAVPGYLIVDKGIAGKNVLNALGIVIDGFPDGVWADTYN